MWANHQWPGSKLNDYHYLPFLNSKTFYCFLPISSGNYLLFTFNQPKPIQNSTPTSHSTSYITNTHLQYTLTQLKPHPITIHNPQIKVWQTCQNNRNRFHYCMQIYLVVWPTPLPILCGNLWRNISILLHQILNVSHIMRWKILLSHPPLPIVIFNHCPRLGKLIQCSPAFSHDNSSGRSPFLQPRATIHHLRSQTSNHPHISCHKYIYLHHAPLLHQKCNNSENRYMGK